MASKHGGVSPPSFECKMLIKFQRCKCFFDQWLLTTLSNISFTSPWVYDLISTTNKHEGVIKSWWKESHGPTAVSHQRRYFNISRYYKLLLPRSVISLVFPPSFLKKFTHPLKQYVRFVRSNFATAHLTP